MNASRIRDWYYQHMFHVDKLVVASTYAIEPSGSDRNKPELWKGIHWKWFFESNKTCECIACEWPATTKSYRTRNGITDGYPTCGSHFAMDDGNFWKAVHKREQELMEERPKQVNE